LTKHFIFDDGAEFGFMYTSHNNIPNSNVNFLALDVPNSEDIQMELGNLVMTNLAHHAVAPGLNHGDKGCGPTTAFCLKKIDDPEHLAHVFSRYMTCTEQSTTIFEIVPLYHHQDPKQWGKFPFLHPGANSNVQIAVQGILNKWQEQLPSLVINRHPGWDLPSEVIEEASLEAGVSELVDSIGKTDSPWEDTLNFSEKALINTDPKFFQDAARVYLRPPKKCAHCKILCEPKTERFYMCSSCKMTHYCCPEHQTADWEHHKVLCKVVCAKR
jgi:hypothetical protein